MTRRFLYYLSIFLMTFALISTVNATDDTIKISKKVVRINYIAGINHQCITKLIDIISSESLKGNNDFQLVIYSTGGDVDYAITAYNYINGINVNVNTYNISDIGSAANILFAIGKRRYAFERSYFYYHRNTLSINMTDRSSEYELRLGMHEFAKENNFQISKNVLPRLSKQDLEKYFNEGKIIYPKEAKELGLINDIVDKLPKADIIYNIN